MSRNGMSASAVLPMANHVIEPVTVWETISRRRTLDDVEGASRWLLTRWPRYVIKPRSYGKALRACLAVLEGSGNAALARKALVQAADDAGILDQA